MGGLKTVFSVDKSRVCVAMQLNIIVLFFVHGRGWRSTSERVRAE